MKKQDNSTALTSATETTITKKIGQTMYQIQIHFSQNSKESFSDKLLRLAKNEIAENMKAG